MEGNIDHIMMVDDEDDYHLIVRMMLKRAGYAGRLTAFHSAEDAIGHLDVRTDMPDLLLVDINMPGMDGFEFITTCEERRLLPAHGTTVIMCSSSNRPLDMDAAKRFNSVNGYVEKTLTVERFERIRQEHAERLRA
ncbi:MAG: response regulator [Flavobacteriales bacterium]